MLGGVGGGESAIIGAEGEGDCSSGGGGVVAGRSKFSAADPEMLERSAELPTRETEQVARSTAWKSVAAQSTSCTAKLADPDSSALPVRLPP